MITGWLDGLKGGETRLVRWLLIGLILLGFALRVNRLEDRNVWWDEGWSLFVARGSFTEVLSQTATDRHPPLYFLLLQNWIQAAGEGEFATRLPSVFAGTLTIAATFGLARRVGGVKAAMLAALIVATSRFGIGWSQEVRQYILASLLAALVLWAAILAWDRGRTRYYAAYVLAMTAGLYTLYLFAVLFVASNVGWFIGWLHSKQRRRAFGLWLGAQLLVIFLVTPWLVYALPRYLSGTASPPVAMLALMKIYWTIMVIGIPLEVDRYAVYTLPVLLLFLTGIIYLAWKARENWQTGRDLATSLTALAGPIVIVQLLAISWIGFGSLPAAPRLMLAFLPIYALLLAWGIASLVQNRWSLTLLFGILLLFVSLVGLRGYHRGRVFRDDYRSLATALQSFEQPGDTVVLLTDKDWPIFAFSYQGQWRGVPHSWQLDEQTTDSFLSGIWEDSDAVWLVTTQYAAEKDPEALMAKWLNLQAVSTREYSFGEKALHLFSRTESRSRQEGLLPTTAKAGHVIDEEISSDLTLVGFDQPAQDYRTGDSLRPFLYWQVDENSSGHNVTIELGVLDGENKEWIKKEIVIPAGKYAPESLVGVPATITAPPDLPTGEYAFFVRVPGGETARFGGFNVRGRDRAILTEADLDITEQLIADFGDEIRLLGYNLPSADVEPGSPLELTLFWQAMQPVEGRYKVFTHLLGEVYNAETGNFLWGQQDNEPVNNRRPTTTWLEGEVIVDEYAIPIGPNIPPGVYKIEIGLYDPNSGLRLQVLDDLGQTLGDHLIVTNIQVGQ